MKQITQILILFFCFSLTSCVYKFGGAEVYEATSNNEVYKDSIKKYNIQYVSPATYEIFWAAFYKKDGDFAMNVTRKDEKISWTPISKEIAEKWQLKPNYNIWQKFGFWILLSAVLLFAAKEFFFDRK